MAQKEQVYKGTIKQSGYWKFSEVYTLLYDWLKDNGYDVNEELYKEVAGSGKEIIIKWNASKKVTDYIKYEISLDWHILGMKDAEVEVDGAVKKTNKGELGISIKATLIKDYEGKWEDKPIWKFLRGIYDNYITRSTISEYSDELEDEVSSMIDELKAFLRLGS